MKRAVHRFYKPKVAKMSKNERKKVFKEAVKDRLRNFYF